MPTIVSVSPINSSGNPQIFTATYASNERTADLYSVQLLFNSSFIDHSVEPLPHRNARYPSDSRSCRRSLRASESATKVRPFSSMLMYADQDSITPIPSQMAMLESYIDLEYFMSRSGKSARSTPEARPSSGVAGGMEQIFTIAPAGSMPGLAGSQVPLAGCSGLRGNGCPWAVRQAAF